MNNLAMHVVVVSAIVLSLMPLKSEDLQAQKGALK